MFLSLLFCFSYSFLQHLFPPLLDVVGKLGGEDVANLLFVATECHVALDEFLAGAAAYSVPASEKLSSFAIAYDISNSYPNNL